MNNIEAIFENYPGVNVLFQDEKTGEVYFTAKTAECKAVTRGKTEQKINKTNKK